MDCIVVGNEWNAPWQAIAMKNALAKKPDARVGCWIIDRTCGTELLPIYIGSGETRARTELSFGKEPVRDLWEFSEANFQTIHAYLQKHRLEFVLGEAAWMQADQVKESSASLLVKQSALADLLYKQAVAQGIEVQKIDSLDDIAQLRAFEYGLTGSLAGKKIQSAGTTVILATERIPMHCLPGVSDILLPATLNRFIFPMKRKPASLAMLFNEGADFAFQNGAMITVGSVRNLYSDRGYGIREGWTDKVSQEHVGKFFENKGWLDASQLASVEVHIESISCDGLPLVGNLSSYPGVILVSGFGGHSSNYFFEMAQQIAAAVAGFTPKRSLDRFSLKRF